MCQSEEIKNKFNRNRTHNRRFTLTPLYSCGPNSYDINKENKRALKDKTLFQETEPCKRFKSFHSIDLRETSDNLSFCELIKRVYFFRYEIYSVCSFGLLNYTRHDLKIIIIFEDNNLFSNIIIILELEEFKYLIYYAPSTTYRRNRTHD